MQKKNFIIVGILFIITSSFTPGGNGFYDSFFSAPATPKVVIAIYSFYGKKMSEQRLSTNKVSFILDDNYTRGLYVFQLRDQAGRLIESGKFQVNK
ncbi:MAG: hypothetical protein NTW77_04365 [Bacteroidetes bacterium]|nr:hypothetical protein [Bacteroidota bacterium]